MRFWPFRRETRASTYTDAISQAFAALAGGDVISEDLAALEICMGWWGRCFASAKVTPDTPATRALTPDILNAMGRNLARFGECILEITMQGGALTLNTVSSCDISGGAMRSSWTYALEVSGPDTVETRTVPAARVVHAQYSYLNGKPWVGVGPLQGLTKTAATHLEQALSYEASGPVGSVLPSPPSKREELQEGIRKLRGTLVVADSMAAGYDTGAAGAPKDFEVKRIGPVFSPHEVTVRDSISASLLAACGISPAMLLRSDGTLLREAYKIFTLSTMMPVAKIVTPELERKLEVEGLNFDFTSLRSADIQARARAYAGMVGAGLAPDVAGEISGILEADA